MPTLVEVGQNASVVVAAGMKGKPDKHAENWFFPGRQDCLTCRTRASGGVLGRTRGSSTGPFATLTAVSPTTNCAR